MSYKKSLFKNCDRCVNEKTNFILSSLTLKYDTKLNVCLERGEDRDYNFWSEISPNLLKEVLHYYRYDFEAFNYSAKEYFENLKLYKFSNLLYGQQ